MKFSPPKSLCGTVGSPWVLSLATLFGFWETLITFSESMILYGKKSFFRFFFFTYKCGRGRPISTVSQMLKNVNQDLQGCPTIPHDHSMCLHHPVGAYLCVLSTIIFPYKSRKSKKKINFHHPNTRKDLGFCILVKSSQYKGEVRNSKFEKLIELCRGNVRGVYARSCDNCPYHCLRERLLELLFLFLVPLPAS